MQLSNTMQHRKHAELLSAAVHWIWIWIRRAANVDYLLQLLSLQIIGSNSKPGSKFEMRLLLGESKTAELLARPSRYGSRTSETRWREFPPSPLTDRGRTT